MKGSCLYKTEDKIFVKLQKVRRLEVLNTDKFEATWQQQKYFLHQFFLYKTSLPHNPHPQTLLVLSESLESLHPRLLHVSHLPIFMHSLLGILSRSRNKTRTITTTRTRTRTRTTTRTGFALPTF